MLKHTKRKEMNANMIHENKATYIFYVQSNCTLWDINVLIVPEFLTMERYT